jgi:hypothetical protein
MPSKQPLYSKSLPEKEVQKSVRQDDLSAWRLGTKAGRRGLALREFVLLSHIASLVETGGRFGKA